VIPVPERASGWDRSTDPEKDAALIPDPAATEVPAQLRATIEAAMARYPDSHSAAIPALHAAQELHGWCSPQAIEQVACVMQVTPAYLDSVASFYDMLENRPVGRHSVYVGPLSIDDVPQLLDDARSGRAVLPDKQLATRLVADPHANSGDFPRHAIEEGSSR
jgi:Thioredoxin-like [2Fe-2S] ferredoxin